MTGWIDEHDYRLEELRNKGLSATEIGVRLTHEFGITRNRNMVLGRKHRLGLSSSLAEIKAQRILARKAKEASFDQAQAALGLAAKPSPKTRPKVARPKPALPGPITSHLKPGESEIYTVAPAPKLTPKHEPGMGWLKLKPPMAMPVCEPNPDGVTLAVIRPNQCRWIPGEPAGLDTVMCGTPVLTGKSYCAVCFPRMLTPWQRRAA